MTQKSKAGRKVCGFDWDVQIFHTIMFAKKGLHNNLKLAKIDLL